MRTRTEAMIAVEGHKEVVADFREAGLRAGIKASRELKRAAEAARDAARASVPVESGATRLAIVATKYGRRNRIAVGDLDVKVGSLPRAAGGMSAAAFLTFGTSRHGPKWDFFGEVEPHTRALASRLEDVVGDL